MDLSPFGNTFRNTKANVQKHESKIVCLSRVKCFIRQLTNKLNGLFLQRAYLKICGLPFKPLIAKFTGASSNYFKQVSKVLKSGKHKEVLSNSCSLHGFKKNFL